MVTFISKLIEPSVLNLHVTIAKNIEPEDQRVHCNSRLSMAP